jgi:hypothetical protein
MLKKRFVLPAIAALIACTILIPPVRAAAESVLSVFRVAEVKTIRISVQDLQDMVTFLEQEGADKIKESGSNEILEQLMGKAEAAIRPLSDISQFNAFPFSLPSALKDETPELYSSESQTQAVTLDTGKINEELSALGAAVPVDSIYDGTVMTVSAPPVIMAKYSDMLLAATQSIYLDAPDDVISSLYASFLSIPMIPENLRAQLAVINPQTRDVYLPVIEGLGRETSLGGVTGYIYSSGDLAQVLGMMPGFAGDEQLEQMQGQNASVLIWLKDSVVYFLAGNQSDSELSRIAGSIR